MRRSPLRGLLCFLALALPAGSVWAQTTGPKSAAVERTELSPITGGVQSGLGAVPALTPGLSAATLSGSLAPLAGPQAVLGPQVSPSALVTAPVLAPAPALSAPAVLPPATQAKEDAETTLETVQGRPNRLGLRIDEARKLWAAPQDRTTDVSVAAYSPAVAQVSLNVESQLAAMAAIPGNENDPLFAMISRNAHGFLKTIDQHIKSGAIDPGISIRTSASDSAKPVAGRQLRVGIYAVSGDPLHWAHLLIGLQAIAQLKLDKVVFVVAGDDARKPNMTPAAVRHPMDREVLEAFRPFFGYSSIAVGTDLDGETNLFRILALNPDQKMRVYSIGGDDHYRLKDKNGNDDTIPKVEKNMSRPELRFNPAVHQVGLAFIEREGRAEEVPTVLEVQFLPKIEFEASSTAVRKHGRYALMPYSAYDYVKRHKLGLYGIPAD